MGNRHIPFALSNSLQEIPFSFFAKHGIKVILCDLDNTLDAFDVNEPNETTKQFVSSLQAAGLTFMIASNNSSNRVTQYAKALGVNCAHGLFKPLSFGLQRLIKEKGFDKNSCVLIGDQVVTDIFAGNGAGIKTILVSPLSKHDPWWTMFNRVFDNYFRKRITKKKLALNWREMP